MQRNQLKAVILTTFSPTEYHIVRSHLLERREFIGQQGNVYDRGVFSTPGITWDILLGQMGTGNIESAIEAERAINIFHPDIILSIGLAYGFKNVQIGDVVAVTKAYSYERGKETEGGFKSRPEANQSTYRMIQRAQAEARNTDWQRALPVISAGSMAPKVFIGPLAAGEKEVTSSSKFWQFLEDHYNDTLAIDTSSSGFLGATHSIAHIEALIIRGIVSTISDSCSIVSAQKAACHATTFAFTVLSKLSANQFLQYEGPLADPLIQLEQLAYGNVSTALSVSNRNITLHTATSASSDPSLPSSDATKETQTWFDKGNQYCQQQMYKDAVKAYNKELRSKKNDPKIYNNKGIALFRLSDYAAALEAYTSAINCDPNYADAYSNKAAVHYKLNDYREAQRFYQHAIDLYNHMIAKEQDEEPQCMLQKHLASAFTGMGDTLCVLGDYRVARTHYSRALKLDPTKASAYIGRGKCLILQERFRDALADYKRAIEYDLNNPDSHQGRGNAYQGLKQWKKAVESYDQALLLKSSDEAGIYRAKGIAYSWLDEYHQALEAFNAFCRLSPDNILSYRYVIATLEKLRYHEEVLKVCGEACQRFTNDDWILMHQQKALLELAKLHQHVEEQDTTVLPVISGNQAK